MKVLGVNNKIFNFQVEKFQNNILQFVLETDHGEMMGELTFRIKNEKAWLYSIATMPEFQRKGVAQTLINIFECYCAKNRCDIVEGRYMPSNEHAYDFYHKNNYLVYKDGYEQYLYKKLNIKQILNNTKYQFIKDEDLVVY